MSNPGNISSRKKPCTESRFNGIPPKEISGAHTPPLRIEVYENDKLIPLSPEPPVVSASSQLGEDAILERYVTPHSAEYKEHKYPTHVLFLYEGTPSAVEWKSQGRRYNAQLQSGLLWILPRGLRLSAHFHGPHGGVVLSIGQRRFERQIYPLLRGGSLELAVRFNVRDSQLEYLLRGLLAIAQEGSQGDAMVGDLLVNAICIRLARHFSVSQADVPAPRGGLPAARLKRVIEFIDANLDKNIRLGTLADTADMSLYYFATLFRQSLGVSPHQYIIGRRVERAKQLLRHTNLSLLDVSLALGFEHQNNFARTFRRVMGLSPRTYRDSRTLTSEKIERNEQNHKI
jgi:AraC family transcriptional regulator